MPAKVKVRILAGRNLPVMDKSSDASDAFVEVKLGNTTYKTEVYRRSLNPFWNSEWFRFEVSDQELQDEPLQIRIMDYDTYSANDAIGKVYINLNPLLLNPCRSMSGWLPIYDTLHGIRGEINCMVKVNLFSDNNRFRHSSCGVRFFFSDIPNGYKCDAILGFVDELLVNDDPEYQWIDKIRTPRASNEARQTLFTKLSGEVQRKLGLKAEIFGGNAVIGYQQSFDLEGGSGIVGRGIGTAVVLSKIGHEHANNHGRQHQSYHTTSSNHHHHQLGPSSLNPNLFHMNNSNYYNSQHLHQHPQQLLHHHHHLNSPYHIHPTAIHHSMADRSGGSSSMHQYYKSTPGGGGSVGYPYLGERHLVHSVSADFFYEVPTSRNIAMKKELSEAASVAKLCAATQEQLSDTSDLETFVTLRSDDDGDDETDVDELDLAIDDLERANQPLGHRATMGGSSGARAAAGSYYRKRGARQQLTKSLSLMNARELMGRSPMLVLSSSSSASGTAATASRCSSSRGRANIAGYLRRHTQDIEQKLVELTKPVSVTSIKSKQSAVKLIKLLSNRTKSQQNQQNGGSTKTATTLAATTTITIDDTSAVAATTTTSSKTSRQAKTASATITSPSKGNNLASSKLRSTNSSSSQSQSTESNAPSSPAPSQTSAVTGSTGSGNDSQSLVSAGAAGTGTSSGKRRRERSGPSATVASSDDALSIIEEKHDDDDADADNGGKTQGDADEDDDDDDEHEDADGCGADDRIVHDDDETSRSRLLSGGSATSGRSGRHSRRITRGKEIDLSGELDEPSSASESHGVASSGGSRRVKGVSVSSGVDEDESSETAASSRVSGTVETTNQTSPNMENSDKLPQAGEDDSLALSTSSPSSSVLTDETIRAAKDEPSSSLRSSTLTVTAASMSSSRQQQQPKRTQKAATFDETDLASPSGAGTAEFALDVPSPAGSGQPLNRSESARHHTSKQRSTLANSIHHQAGNTCGTPEPGAGSHRHKTGGAQFVSSSAQQQKARISGNHHANFAQSVGVIKAQQHLLQNMIRHQNENLVWSSMNKARGALVYPGRIHQSEYPFVTLKRFPDGLIQCTGGVVSVHSVKLLDHIINDEESETRDNWWTEIRKEIRSHAKSLNCNTILGYTETSRVLGDVCILSARGTAAILKPLEFQQQTNPTHWNPSIGGGGPHRERTLSSSNKVRRMSTSPPPPPQLIASHASMPPIVVAGAAGAAATASSSSAGAANANASANATTPQTVSPDLSGHPNTGSSLAREEVVTPTATGLESSASEKFRRHSVSLDGGAGPQSQQSAALIDCSFAHSPLRCVESIESLSNCAICCSNKVPDVLLLTIEPPKSLNIVSTCSLVQARVCRAKRDSHGEASAKEIGDALPFLEYELHRQLFSKLKFKGMNCLFNLEIDISVGENFLTGLATGTGCFVLGLPTPQAPKISAGKGIKAAKLNEIQRLIALSATKNRDLLGLEQITRQLDEYHRQIGLFDLSPSPSSRLTVGGSGGSGRPAAAAVASVPGVRDAPSAGALGSSAAELVVVGGPTDQDSIQHPESMSASPSGGAIGINSITKTGGIMQPQLSQGTTTSTTSQTLSSQLQQQQDKPHKHHHHHHGHHHHHHHHRKSPRLGSHAHRHHHQQQNQAHGLQQDLDGRPTENLVNMMDDDNNIILEVDDNEDADIIALLIDSDIPSGYMICNSEIVPTIDQGSINSINMFTQVMRVKLNGIDQFAQQFDFILQTLYVKLRRSLPCCLTNLNFVVDLPESYIVQITVTGCLLGLNLNYPGASGSVSGGGVVSKQPDDSNSSGGLQQQQQQEQALDRAASGAGLPVTTSDTGALSQGQSSTKKKQSKPKKGTSSKLTTTKASSTSMSPTSTTSATNSSCVSTASGSSVSSTHKANKENKRRASNTSTGSSSSSGKAKSSSSSSTSSSSSSSSTSSSSSLSTNESAADNLFDTKKQSPGKAAAAAVPASATLENVKKSSLRSSSRTNLAALISAGKSTLSGERRSKSKVEIELVDRGMELDGVTPSTRATQEAIKHEIQSNRLGSGESKPASSVAKAAARKLRPVFKKQQTYPGATSPAISGQDNILASQHQAVHLGGEFVGGGGGAGGDTQQHQPAGSSGGGASSNARKQAAVLLNKVKQPFKDLGSSFNSSLPLGSGSPASQQQQQHIGPMEPNGTNSGGTSGASSAAITPTNHHQAARPGKSRGLSGPAAANSQEVTAPQTRLQASNGPPGAASSRLGPQNHLHSGPTSCNPTHNSQHTDQQDQNSKTTTTTRRSSFASSPPTTTGAAANQSMTAGGGAGGALESRCFSSSSLTRALILLR